MKDKLKAEISKLRESMQISGQLLGAVIDAELWTTSITACSLMIMTRKDEIRILQEIQERLKKLEEIANAPSS